MTAFQRDDQQVEVKPVGALLTDGGLTAVDYWRRKLSGLPRLDLPADGCSARTPSPKTRSVPVRLGAGTVASLRRIASAEDTSMYVVLLAGYKVLLAHLTGQRDV